MTELEIIKEQVKQLEKLIEIKNKIISELEKNQRVITDPLFSIKGDKTFYNPCALGCDYITKSSATSPIACSRCGKLSPFNFYVTNG